MTEQIKTNLKNMGVKSFIALFILVAFFLGYALGRAYKTYEIKIAADQNQNLPDQNLATQNNQPTFEKELVNPNVYAPRIIKLNATKDVAGNYQLKIDTLYFRHTPEKAGQPVQQNAGHANIFVNNKFTARTVGPQISLPVNLFNSGTNTISVSLHANNGNAWWSKKGTLEARANIEVVK